MVYISIYNVYSVYSAGNKYRNIKYIYNNIYLYIQKKYSAYNVYMEKIEQI